MHREFATFATAIRCVDLSLEDLQKNYDFYCNAYTEGGNVWWTNTGGGGAGGAIDNFLSVLRLNNYAFGPPKKQKGWGLDRLGEKGAVGVYKLKSARNPGSNRA